MMKESGLQLGRSCFILSSHVIAMDVSPESCPAFSPVVYPNSCGFDIFKSGVTTCHQNSRNKRLPLNFGESFCIHHTSFRPGSPEVHLVHWNELPLWTGIWGVFLQAFAPSWVGKKRA